MGPKTRAAAFLLCGVVVGGVLTRTFLPRERYPHLAAAVDAGVDRRIAEIHVRERPLAEVFDLLREKSGANIFVDWSELAQFGILPDQRMTLELRDVRLGAALDVLAADLSENQHPFVFWTAADGVIRFTYPDVIRRSAVICVYDVRDLVGYSPIRVDTSGWMSGGDFDGREELAEEIIQLIQETVAPESWREAGGSVGSIRELDYRLVIHQTPEAHRQIEELLRQLRAPAVRP